MNPKRLDFIPIDHYPENGKWSRTIALETQGRVYRENGFVVLSVASELPYRRLGRLVVAREVSQAEWKFLH